MFTSRGQCCVGLLVLEFGQILLGRLGVGTFMLALIHTLNGRTLERSNHRAGHVLVYNVLEQLTRFLDGPLSEHTSVIAMRYSRLMDHTK